MLGIVSRLLVLDERFFFIVTAGWTTNGRLCNEPRAIHAHRLRVFCVPDLVESFGDVARVANKSRKKIVIDTQPNECSADEILYTKIGRNIERIYQMRSKTTGGKRIYICSYLSPFQSEWHQKKKKKKIRIKVIFNSPCKTDTVLTSLLCCWGIFFCSYSLRLLCERHVVAWDCKDCSLHKEVFVLLERKIATVAEEMHEKFSHILLGKRRELRCEWNVQWRH